MKLFVAIVLSLGALTSIWAAEGPERECDWTRCPTNQAELHAQQINKGSHCPAGYQDMGTKVDCNNPGVAVPDEMRPKKYKCCKHQDTKETINIISKDKVTPIIGGSPSATQTGSG